MFTVRKGLIAVSSNVVISLISLVLGTVLVQAQSAANQTESACILKAGPVDEPNGGPTDYSLFLHPIGILRGVMIFVDFPDAEYRETTNDLYNLLVPYSQKWLNEVSYGRMSLQVTPVPKWYRMSKPSIEYGFTSKKPPMTFEQHRAYIAEAIHLAEADVSFKDYQFVTVVAAVGSQIPPSPAFHARTGQGILTEGIEVRHAITFGADIRRVIPNFGAKVFVHEMGHLLGLPDLYDYDASRPVPPLQWRFAGGWSEMSSNVTGGHYFAYEKLKLGWLDPSQVQCMTSPGTLQATITPLETSGGLKAIIMRTGPSTAHVVELREAIGADSRLCDHGALIYTVDATLENGHGIIKLAPAQQGTDPAAVLRCGVLYDGTYDLRPDKRANYSDPRTGIEVQLISERDNSYVVRVTWKKPD